MKGESSRLVVHRVPDRPGAAIAGITLEDNSDASASSMPVVYARATRQVVPGADLPIARPGAPRPLAATAQPAAAHPAGERAAPATRGDAVSISNAPAPERAARGPETARAEPAAMDIDEIVDRVHRKFVRRLAIEGERRGVR